MYKNTKYSRAKDLIFELHEKGLSPQSIADQLKKTNNIYYNRGGVLHFLKSYYPNFNSVCAGYKGYKDADEVNAITEQMQDNGIENGKGAVWKHAWLKSKDGASIFVRNMSEVVSFDEMREELMQGLKEYSPKFKKLKRKPVTDPHLLVIDIADLHIGKLAHKEETGEDYNNEVAIQRALDGVDGILQKAKGFAIDKILFVIGNDVLHTDGHTPSTTSGTPQDTTKMWWKNYLEARDLYIRIIETLTLIADVHVVHNPSNHDYVSGFMLADSIYCWFRNHRNITFDVSNNHRKYFKYGQSLIGTSHGDGAKINELPLIMANEALQEWSCTKWRYIYLHHVHHKDLFKFRSAKDYQGCTVEYLRSPSGTDSWHHRNGYTLAPKAIEGFIHSKEFGQVARLTHLFR
jgi:hypothetical protein